MPRMNGPTVRHTLARENRDLAWLSTATRIPHGTLKNATRERLPQGISLARVYQIAATLGLTYDELVGGRKDGGVPDTPPKQPKGPSHPPKRRDGEGDRKGPKRAVDKAVNAA